MLMEAPRHRPTYYIGWWDYDSNDEDDGDIVLEYVRCLRVNETGDARKGKNGNEGSSRLLNTQYRRISDNVIQAKSARHQWCISLRVQSVGDLG